LMISDEENAIAEFKSVTKVISNSEKFKIKLGIGSDAYTSLKAGNSAAKLWSLGGAASTGVSVAASNTVASVFFGTFWTGVGIGTAVTPVGWLVGAALASGGACYGVSRLYQSYSGKRVQEVPKFLNSGLDVLGSKLFDLMGSLALKVAAIDGTIDPSEITAINEYFCEEWGYDQSYIDQAVEVLIGNIDRARLTDITASLTGFAKNNPDCNLIALQTAVSELLIEIAQSDGKLDEREEMAIEQINNSLSEHGSKLGVAGDLISGSAAGFGKLVGGATSNLQSKLTNVAVKLRNKKPN
jgi:uncharacterized tellurite resistance protein B-like protein